MRAYRRYPSAKYASVSAKKKLNMRAYMRILCAHICAKYARIYAQRCAYLRIYAHTYAYMRILTHICTHICATLRILTHICAYLRIYAQSKISKYAHICAYMRIFDDLRYAHIYAYMRILADGYRHMAVSVRHQKSGMRGNPNIDVRYIFIYFN